MAVDNESIFFVEALFAPDAARTRGPYRMEHVKHIRELLKKGSVIEAGAFIDELTTSVLLVRAESASQAREIVESDVYFANGVWTDVHVRPFARLLASPSH